MVLLGLAASQAQPPLAQPPQPQPPQAQSPGPAADLKSPEETRKQQEANARQFKELSRKLLELAVKLDRSDRPEDRDRAKTIRAALELAEKAGVDNQFQALIAGMSNGSRNLQDLEKLIGQDEELSRTLLDMLNVLLTDDETARLRAEIARLEKFLKEAEHLKRRQETIRAITESKKGSPEKIGRDQNDVAEQTRDLAERMGGGKAAGSGTEQPSRADPKSADTKDGDKAAEPRGDTQQTKSEGKPGDAAAGEAKPSGTGREGQPGGESPPSGRAEPETRPTDPASGQPAPPTQPKDASQGKSSDKPSAGQPGEGKGKQAQSGEQQASGKSGGQAAGSSGSPNQPPRPASNTPGRKSIEEAYPHQKSAEEDVRKDQRDSASKKMDQAIEKLAQAIEEMKKRLKQLREEELLKLLANLEARCNRMLAMQIEVYQNTKAIHDVITRNHHQKTTADIQKAQQQADKEKEIIAEAERTLKLLESEGTAVAFARVLEEVMGDMIAVQNRLDKAMVGEDTQFIEENIIMMLKDMVAALKKQQQEMQNNQNNPNSGGGKPNQQLIDQLAELKLIRALQSQVNSRTIMYGKQSEGEQANDPLVQAELRQLAQRQLKLQEMIHKLATQANR